ncbi:tRNA dimethylallyltransferase 2 [Populus alba]|nr:tRNA dimethylallyltransferase 2 [Populus alba]
MSCTARLPSERSTEREMESDSAAEEALQNPSNTDGGEKPTVTKKEEKEEKPKVVVIMGPTGSGKSKLAIDLAAHFPVEIINADSMQVYRGLDVLTNKVPISDQEGVPHHLLGTVNPSVEFTAKDFRDSAIPLINEILSRNCLPVIVGGTNYYIQALVSPFLLDDTTTDLDESFLNHPSGDEQADHAADSGRESFNYSYDHLKELDPVAANRLHPNNHRKINQYLNLYARSGILPSKIYQGKAAENWGCMDNYRFHCCFICVDADIPVLDRYVEQRVDSMIDAGLLGEVSEIYNYNAEYTRGLRQAIGVREFDNFLRVYISDEKGHDSTGSLFVQSKNKDVKLLKDNTREILHSSDDNQLKILLAEAIDKVKANTRRLVRVQKRRLTRLQTFFGWNIHYVDATEFISCKSDELWAGQVVSSAVNVIRAFLTEERSAVPDSETHVGSGMKSVERNLWTQYICKACGNRVLRGAHEWEQHKQGRGHRKRICRLRKSQGHSNSLVEQEVISNSS